MKTYKFEMEHDTCNICGETKTKFIECSGCNFKACENCCKTYIISKPQAASCMNCKKEWTRKFLIDNFNKTFINKTYKQHLENIFFEKEKTLLPQAQAYYENEKEKKNVRDEIKECKKKLKMLFLKQNDLMHNKKIETKIFVKKCMNENCRGFLEEDWNCKLCSFETCKKCNTIKFENHECNSGDVETFKLIKKEIKSCPTCGMGIYKIEGCDQMFCTECATAFSWRTGKIETSRIHNPHYFEYLKNNNITERNHLDFVCGREFDFTFFCLIIRKIKNNEIADWCRYICQRINHLISVDLRYYSNDDSKQKCLITRVKYISNDITEKQFKQRLHQINKKSLFKKEMADILDMFCKTTIDIFYRHIHTDNRFYYDKLKFEFLKLLEYTNENLKIICENYNYKQQLIDTEMLRLI